MKRRHEETSEALFAQVDLQHSISGPKVCVLIQGESDIGGVVLVHIPAKPPGFGPAPQTNAVFVDELNPLEDAVQQGEQLRLGKATGISEPAFLTADKTLTRR